MDWKKQQLGQIKSRETSASEDYDFFWNELHKESEDENFHMCVSHRNWTALLNK